jgi:hypothetical protein
MWQLRNESAHLTNLRFGMIAEFEKVAKMALAAGQIF